MTNKELDILACKEFVCPELGLIDKKGKELQLKDETIKRAKDMATEYFKKTYHMPPYSSARHLLPSFIYIASVLEGERRFQKEIIEVFGTTNVTITKWNRHIIDTMGITIICDDMVSVRERKRERIEELKKKYGKIIYPDLDLIEKGGNILGLNYLVIKRAKDLAVRYFKNAYYRSNYPIRTKTVMPSLFYLAGIIEGERKRQMDISITFKVSESSISNCHRDIMDVLGMKIIYGENRKVLKVIEKRNL
jgi:transcription initiation factor TFIIIB Brf1 subunit/transcription initiation factor TFIIB